MQNNTNSQEIVDQKAIEAIKSSPISLEPKEEDIIKALRLQQKKRSDCAKEIDLILKKYNAQLSVDPQSPFGRPEITVILSQ